MPSLAEKYRPSSYADVIAQPNACELLGRLQENHSLCGRAIMLTGATGTGKTTLARITATMIADEFFIEEIDATDLTVSKLKAIEADMHLSAWGIGGRAYIVNECQSLKRDVVTQLLVTLERIPAHVCWLFTTTIDGQLKLDGLSDGQPFQDRCLQVQLARQGLSKPFAAALLAIAKAEKLCNLPDAEAEKKCIRILQDCHNSMRAAIQTVESGSLL